MLIDFERAAMIKFGPKNNGVHKEGAMQKLSSNKRRKLKACPFVGLYHQSCCRNRRREEGKVIAARVQPIGRKI